MVEVGCHQTSEINVLVFDSLSLLLWRFCCYQTSAITVASLWYSDINSLVKVLLLSNLAFNVISLWLSDINALVEVLLLSNLGNYCY